MNFFHTPIINLRFTKVKQSNIIFTAIGEDMDKITKNKKMTAYFLIFLVLVIWGIAPPLNVVINKDYSVGLRLAVIGFISAIALLFCCIKKLKKLNKQYFLVAVPTGFFLALASLVQKVGLIYTTPTKYAFLENISCVVVPILLFFAIKKKPSFLTVISCVLCLVGSFVLSGLTFNQESISFGKGELLCALAGVFYAVNIAFTGIYIKKFDTMLYLLIQLWTTAIFGLIFAILMSVIKINGEPIEVMKFSWNLSGIALLIVLALVSNLLCWFLRTYAMRFVSPVAVSVIMPFSAVVTGVVSILSGMDTVSGELIYGGIITLVAIILSSIADLKGEDKISESKTQKIIDAKK